MTNTYNPQPELRNALFFWLMQGKTIATLHDWENGRYIKPRSLSKDELEKLVDLKKVDEPPKLYHPRLIGDDTWWCPAKRRPIRVDRSDRKVFDHPPLVFKLRKRALYVAMLKKNEQPKEGTMLYLAPYQGTDLHTDKVGLCGVTKPQDNNIEAWENAFFLSMFNKLPVHREYKALGRIESWIL